MIINWEEYFMNVAILSSLRSKDPNTQVGACVVKDNKILSCGYNGFPNVKNNDNLFSWDKNENWLISKSPYVVHAELNAILNTNLPLAGATMYVTLFPCNDCAKAIVQSGIKEIVYLADSKHDKEETIASKRLLDICGIKYRKFSGNILINYLQS